MNPYQPGEDNQDPYEVGYKVGKKESADRIEELERELECERIRLAACSVVALANTPESAAKAREVLPKYRSASCNDVARIVDSEMALHQERDAMQADNARLREAFEILWLGTNPNEWDGKAVELFEAALSHTPEQSLARLRNQVLDEAINVAWNHEPDCNGQIEMALRKLKEPE